MTQRRRRGDQRARQEARDAGAAAPAGVPPKLQPVVDGGTCHYGNSSTDEPRLRGALNFQANRSVEQDQIEGEDSIPTEAYRPNSK
jgi:hypothetical protein